MSFLNTVTTSYEHANKLVAFRPCDTKSFFNCGGGPLRIVLSELRMSVR
jgi:hypothetical protein